VRPSGFPCPGAGTSWPAAARQIDRETSRVIRFASTCGFGARSGVCDLTAVKWQTLGALGMGGAVPGGGRTRSRRPHLSPGGRLRMRRGRPSAHWSGTDDATIANRRLLSPTTRPPPPRCHPLSHAGPSPTSATWSPESPTQRDSALARALDHFVTLTPHAVLRESLHPPGRRNTIAITARFDHPVIA
jgi:hypothetical protein